MSKDKYMRVPAGDLRMHDIVLFPDARRIVKLVVMRGDVAIVHFFDGAKVDAHKGRDVLIMRSDL